ncbi:MAG: hypothetical protein ABIJ56_19835 [Pseudomonadota bacterium]
MKLAFLKHNAGLCLALCAAMSTAFLSGCNWGVGSEQPGDDADAADQPADGAEGVEMDADDEGDLPPDPAEDPAEDPVEDPAGDAVDLDMPDAEGDGGCTSNEECDDLEPCNGDETCGGDGECHDGTPLSDDTVCETAEGVSGVCRDELCIPDTCGNGEVDDGEECDDENDVGGDGCEINCRFSCDTEADCSDDDGCTDDDCVANDNGRVCDFPYNTAECNDDLYCTLDDACNGEGVCVGTGSPCDDGLACTVDGCDEDADSCSNDPDDLLCTGPALCLPECAADDTGCVAPPDSMTVTCTTPVDPATPSDCIIDLGGLESQAACLSCEAVPGLIDMNETDFGDAAGQCGLDGWSLVPGTGNRCTGRVDGCNPRDARNCCDESDTICVEFGDGYALRSDQDSNCGTGVDAEEWRIEQTFDTTGITDLELCFDFGDHGADLNEGLIIVISDGDNEEQIFCLNGGPRRDVDDRLFPFCIDDLPEWAENNPDLKVTFIVHSEDDGDILYLDSISLLGWLSSCTATIETVLTEDFSGCPDPIPNGWNGWDVTGAPQCPGFECPGQGDSAGADNDSWTMAQTVDASGLDDDVMLCFEFGDDDSRGDDELHVEFDAGSGWQTAWLQTGNLGPNQTCMGLCADLTQINPAAARNPALAIRFSVSTTDSGNQIDIDNISLSGSVTCDYSASVGIGDISDDGGGSYSFTVTDTGGTPIVAAVVCSWDSPPVPVSDYAVIEFAP